MDPHEIPPSETRVGKLPEEVYDWMKSSKTSDESPITNSKT